MTIQYSFLTLKQTKMEHFKTRQFPKSRLATIDICTIGRLKHHIPVMIELDVTDSRKKILAYRRAKGKISFTAWLIKAISLTIKENEAVAAMLNGKRKLVIFEDVNISVVVEKELNGQKVPIPLVIRKANERTIESITAQISEARNAAISEKDIVLHRKSSRMERFYYLLPTFVRVLFWRYLVKHPQFANRHMGNVAFTSIGMKGTINGWFIPISVHPVCFGISSVTRKPVVKGNELIIREILNMTILLDHDVIDGAPMARFISNLSRNIQEGIGLSTNSGTEFTD